MKARIYKPAKTAMSQGKAKTHKWRLEFDPADRLPVDPLMGWTGSTDTRRQVALDFATKEEAIAYAEREGIPYRVLEAHEPKRAVIAYADNFRTSRRIPWTH